jgi:hypothetical protein
VPFYTVPYVKYPKAEIKSLTSSTVVVVGFQQDNVMAHASIAPVVTMLCTGKIRFAAVFAGLEATGWQHLNIAVEG